MSMKSPHFISPVVIAALLMVGCEKKPVVIIDDRKIDPHPASDTKTLETWRLGGTIDLYEKAPTVENEADVMKAFAELDGEIAELVGHVAKKEGAQREEAAQKLVNLREYRVKEDLRFKKAQLTAPNHVAKSEPTLGEKIERTTEKVGDKIERAADKAVDGVKDAVR